MRKSYSVLYTLYIFSLLFSYSTHFVCCYSLHSPLCAIVYKYHAYSTDISSPPAIVWFALSHLTTISQTIYLYLNDVCRVDPPLNAELYTNTQVKMGSKLVSECSRTSRLYGYFVSGFLSSSSFPISFSLDRRKSV